MRLPLVHQISTKDGVSNKNSRLTNVLKEIRKTGDIACVRPGLSASDSYSGIGNGLIPFDGRLLLVYGDTVYDQNDNGTWPLDAPDWSVSDTYAFGDPVWFDGDLWFSRHGGNVGNTPAAGYYWARSEDPFETDTYDAGTTYDIGDSVIYGGDGTRYYSYVTGNTGNTPSSLVYWETTPPGTARYQGGLLVAPSTSGPICASVNSAGLSCAALRSYYDCSHKSGINQWTENPVTRSSAPYYVDATQFQGDCSSSVNQGTVSIAIVIAV